VDEESDSEDEEPIDESDVSGLHQFYTWRCARLQEVRDQVESLRRALRGFEKGYVAVDDTVDTDSERDENYRPDPRQLRPITGPTPLWQRQPEIAALHRRRVQRIRRLEGRIQRMSSEVREDFTLLYALRRLSYFTAARVPWQSPGKPLCTLPTEGAGGRSRVPNVHLQAGLLSNQVARCPMG
jgi:hypothetical protein